MIHPTTVCDVACAIVLNSALADNDNGVDQAEFDTFLDDMMSAPPPPSPPPSKKKSAKKDKGSTKLETEQLKSLQAFYKKHGTTLNASILAAEAAPSDELCSLS